jgi:hypothetical protein
METVRDKVIVIMMATSTAAITALSLAYIACSSSDNLRPIRHFENGGSGSSGVRV